MQFQGKLMNQTLGLFDPNLDTKKFFYEFYLI